MVGKILGHPGAGEDRGRRNGGRLSRQYEVLHRHVAIKVVKKDARLDSSASQSLLHEARASSSLNHPNICTIHEVGETDGELYIVMELVEGKSLRDLSAAGVEKQDAPDKEVMRAGHFSHSGSLARICCWTQHSRNRGVAHNFGRGIVGAVGALSRGPRSGRNRARTSAATY